MKRLLIAIALCALLPGCAIVHKAQNKHSEAVTVHEDVKKDSVGTYHADSTKMLETHTNSVHRKTRDIDTTVIIPGHRVTFEVTMPDTAHVSIFSTDRLHVKDSVDKNGKQHLEIIEDDEAVNVHEHDEDFDSLYTDSLSRAETKADGSAHVKTSALIDSSRKESAVVKTKSVTTLLPWWGWLIIVLAGVVSVGIWWLKKQY